MKMAKTDPEILDGWKDDVLVENDITAAWSGAYQVFGGAWISGVRFGSSQPTSALKEPKYKAKVSTENTSTKPSTPIEVETPLMKAPVNPYYVVKKAPVVPKGNAVKTHWTQVTYLKLRLSSYWNNKSRHIPRPSPMFSLNGQESSTYCARATRNAQPFLRGRTETSAEPLSRKTPQNH